MVILNEKNYIREINSYSKDKWMPLFKIMQEIEKTNTFGEWPYLEKDADGFLTHPVCSYLEIARKFRDIVYSMPIIINFQWMKWDEGRKIARDDNFDYNTIDVPMKCKIITAIVRNDRFCEEALIDAFKSGFILKVLKSIEKDILINYKNGLSN